MAWRSTSTGSGNGNTPGTPVPTGVAINDIVLIHVSGDNVGWTIDQADFPAGFTKLGSHHLTLDGQETAIGWKRLSAVDSGSYTFSSGVGGSVADWTCAAMAFSGRDTVNPPTFTSALSNAANTSPITITAPTLTALAGDDLAWFSAPDTLGTNLGTGHTPPSGYFERYDFVDVNNWSWLSGATNENVAAGATGAVSGTFLLSSGTSGWGAFLVQIPSDGTVTTPSVQAVSPRRMPLGV